jgi:hypothetical protein
MSDNEFHEGNPEGATLWERDPLAAKHMARRLYFQDTPISKIVADTGIPKWKVEKYVEGASKGTADYYGIGWSKEKKDDEEKNRKLVQRTERERLGRIWAKKLVAMEHSVDHLLERLEAGDKLTMNEHKMLVSAAKELHHMKQIEDGKPTDIHGFDVKSPEELIKDQEKALAELKEEHPDLLPPDVEVH